MLDMGQMTPSQVQSYNKRLSPKMRRWAEPQQDSRLENFTTEPIHMDQTIWYRLRTLVQFWLPYVACELKRSREKVFQNCTHVPTVARTVLRSPSYGRQSRRQSRSILWMLRGENANRMAIWKKSWSQNKVRRISKTGQWWTWPRQHFCQLRGQELGIVIFMSHDSWLWLDSK